MAEEKPGGRGRAVTLEGKGSRGSDVTTEIKSNANTKLHYPSHTLANLSPFSLHSFYTFLISPLSFSLPRAFSSIFRFVAFSFSCVSSPSSPSPSPFHPPLFLSVSRFARLFRRCSSLDSNHPLPYRLRISPPDLTYPWGIAPFAVLYGAAPANRRATESTLGLYTSPSPSPRLTIRSNLGIPLRLSFLLFFFPPPLPRGGTRLGPCIARILESPLTVTSFGGEICKNNVPPVD